MKCESERLKKDRRTKRRKMLQNSETAVFAECSYREAFLELSFEGSEQLTNLNKIVESLRKNCRINGRNKISVPISQLTAKRVEKGVPEIALCRTKQQETGAILGI